MQFKRERFDDVFEESLPLLEKHWKEIAHFQDIALEPDRAGYSKVEEAGALRVYTARDEAGVLVGYCVYFVRHNLHYKSSLQASQDVLYIDPTRRGFGREFLKWCDEQLKSEGVQATYQHVKAAHNFGPMLERQGYQLVDLIYAKRLDQ
jgi:GNAT superfamily N-acetyltransferase